MVKLGDSVKDRYSEWEGVVTMKMELFNGSSRFAVSGQDKDGMPTDYHFDEPQLVVLTPAPADVTPKPNGKIKLGEVVRDTTSGWEGVAVGFYLYLNGCVRVEVSGRASKPSLLGKAVPKAYVLDEIIVEPVKKASAVVPQGPPRTGGSRSSSPLR